MLLIRTTAALLASLAFVAVTATTASAEVGGLLLPGDSFPITFEASNNGGKLETVGKKVVQCTKEKASGTIESSTSGKATDDLTGCKTGSINCRSENSKGEKDPIETVLVQNIKGVIFSEKTSSGTLSAGLSSILTETLVVNCGSVKDQIRGNVIGLVSPTLLEVAAGSTITLQSKEEEGRAITGTCLEPKATCEEIAKHPLEANLGGGFEAAATGLTGSVILPKMIFIDD